LVAAERGSILKGEETWEEFCMMFWLPILKARQVTVRRRKSA
jgi:hypothetical protein